MIARELRNFRFRMEDYLYKKNEVVKAAMTLLPVGEYRSEDVSRYLSGVFQKMKEDSVTWNTVVLPFQSGDSISCVRDGQEIHASVSFTPKKLTVEYNEAGSVRHASSVLMTIAPVLFTEEPYRGSSASSFAISTAKSLLLDLMYPEND